MAVKKNSKKKKQGTAKPLSSSFVVIVVLLLAGGAGLVWFNNMKDAERENAIVAHEKALDELRAKTRKLPHPPRDLVNDSVDETIQVAAKNGWKPCPGKCLKLATPGWHHQEAEGFPATDIWFTFKHNGGACAYSQHHIGHIIQTYPDRNAEDVGICPICNGTGWMPKN